MAAITNEQMIKPIRNYILCKPFPSDGISEGGIIVSDAHQAVSNKMEVIAVGEGLPGKPMKLGVGDVVFRVANWGEPIEVDGNTYYLMGQECVLAKL